MWILGLAAAVAVLLSPLPVAAVTGDLNLDGKVDFDDFFIFADNFGRTGQPAAAETVLTTRRDTVVHFIERTLHDTVTVERTITLRDTLTLLDTTVIVEALTETVVVGDLPRLPLQSSWSDVVESVRHAVYWIGYTARPQGATRYDIVFVGTGFAVSEWGIVTNYHVAAYVDDQIKTIRADLEPVMIAIQAGTRVYEGSTFYLGTVNESRSLLGFWDPRYQGDVDSPDIAIFYAHTVDSPAVYEELEYARLGSSGALMDLRVGEEIGVLGFPGVLETNYDPHSLVPNPTFKSGTISALRSYDESSPLSLIWEIALMGKIVQHNLEIAPGNSGSPIFDKRGEVVAIAHAGITGGLALDFGIRADEIRILLRALQVGFGMGAHVNAKALPGLSAGQPYSRHQ